MNIYWILPAFPLPDCANPIKELERSRPLSLYAARARVMDFRRCRKSSHPLPLLSIFLFPSLSPFFNFLFFTFLRRHIPLEQKRLYHTIGAIIPSSTSSIRNRSCTVYCWEGGGRTKPLKTETFLRAIRFKTKRMAMAAPSDDDDGRRNWIEWNLSAVGLIYRLFGSKWRRRRRCQYIYMYVEEHLELDMGAQASMQFPKHKSGIESERTKMR